jgi:hypothetical protein
MDFSYSYITKFGFNYKVKEGEFLSQDEVYSVAQMIFVACDKQTSELKNLNLDDDIDIDDETVSKVKNIFKVILDLHFTLLRSKVKYNLMISEKNKFFVEYLGDIIVELEKVFEKVI